ETEDELVVTAARLVSLFAREPEQDRYADNSSLINTVSARGVPAFPGDKRLEHIFYIGHDTLFSYTGLQKLQLDFQATKPLASFQAQWEEWDGTQWTKIPASIEDSDDSFEEMADGKEYLTVGGKLLLKNYLIKDGTIVFINISPLLQKTIAGFEKSWLRCRLLSPIVPATVSQTAAVHDDQLPEITSVNITATMGTRPDKPLPVEAAFTNMVQVDTTKDLFPFGEKPRVGDTLYLANKEAFSKKDSKVTLNINLGSTGVKTGRPGLSWEFWDGQMWNSLGQVDPDKTNSAKETNYSDNTKAFTQNGENNQ